jgi:hypothetical protein
MHMNIVHKHLEFKVTEEESKNINYLDISISKHNNCLSLGIYRKPTQTDTTIYFMSNHLRQHKLVAYIFYTNGMLTLPITEQFKQEMNVTLTITKSNSFPLQLIHNLKDKLMHKT